MIYDNDFEKTYRFAIEFHGENYHLNELLNDNKRRQIEDRGWKYFSVWMTNSTKTQREKYGTTEEQLIKCCNGIKDFISFGEQKITNQPTVLGSVGM